MRYKLTRPFVSLESNPDSQVRFCSIRLHCNHFFPFFALSLSLSLVGFCAFLFVDAQQSKGSNFHLRLTKCIHFVVLLLYAISIADTSVTARSLLTVAAWLCVYSILIQRHRLSSDFVHFHIIFVPT